MCLPIDSRLLIIFVNDHFSSTLLASLWTYLKPDYTNNRPHWRRLRDPRERSCRTALDQAMLPLAKARKLKSGTKGKAVEYLAVAKITTNEIDRTRSGTIPNSSEALTLYNRAVADPATDAPILIGLK
jgi:hypothetical protein